MALLQIPEVSEDKFEMVYKDSKYKSYTARLPEELIDALEALAVSKSKSKQRMTALAIFNHVNSNNFIGKKIGVI